MFVTRVPGARETPMSYMFEAGNRFFLLLSGQSFCPMLAGLNGFSFQECFKKNWSGHKSVHRKPSKLLIGLLAL